MPVGEYREFLEFSGVGGRAVQTNKDGGMIKIVLVVEVELIVESKVF